MTTIRYRGNKNLLNIAKSLDAFRKVPEECTETTEIGGTLSLVSVLLILLLIYKEVVFYRESNLKFTFKPDVNLNERVKMIVDVTIAMPCVGLSGVDLVDETQQEVFSYGTLKRESTWWELSPDERLYFDRMQQMNGYLREEFHSVADVVFKDILLDGKGLHENIPERTTKFSKPYDACRLYGTLNINKVAGVLHFVSGDTPLLTLSDNHWHLNDFRKIPTNFTHRINKFSFGQLSSAIVQPLEGDERYIHKDSTVIQYFIEIVPTEIHKTFSTINSFQYSVKENTRIVDSMKNSYGMPGIYFKYDWSALKVIVKSDRDNFVQFLVRLCSIISGIVVLSGIINSVLQKLMNLFASKTSEKNTKLDELYVKTKTPTTVLISNDLIDNANKMANEETLSISSLLQ